MTIDTGAPVAPAITSFSNDSGVAGDHVTNDNTLSLTGTAEAGATVKVYDGATLLGSATANGAGAWSFTTGHADRRCAQSDRHGHRRRRQHRPGLERALSVTIDTGAPVAPAITSFSNDSGVAGDHVTNDNTLSLTGTAEAGATVKVYDGATLLGSATANWQRRLELHHRHAR